MTSDTPRLRLGMLGIVAVSLFAALFARLWYLQVMAAPQYRVAAQQLQQRIIVDQAPRGRVLDRNGAVLVDNRIATIVTVDRQKLAALDLNLRSRVLTRLADELTRYGHPSAVADIEARLADRRYSPYAPVPVAEDVPEDLQVYLKEHQDEFTDAVAVESKAVRTYPYGTLAAHLLGYVGAVTQEELDAHEDSPKSYQPGDEIGKTGVEQAYEDALRGTPGERVLEVDAQGDTVQQLDYTAPIPGNDIVLTVDLQIQALAEAALKDELLRAQTRQDRQLGYYPAPAGSTVVLDPRDGAVLAMASYPTYDPAAFTDGIDSNEWAALNDPSGHYPLNNRAIQGEYAPGSTFKLITSYAALRSGVRTPESTIQDPGRYRIPNCSGETCLKFNAGHTAYGTVDLRKALTVSSDVYYYMLGAEFWFNRQTLGDPIQDAAHEFGLGEDSGIPLPSEHDGLVPTPELKQQRHDENPEAFPEAQWRVGDNVNLAIGQGDMLVTPLQLANAYATLANGSTVWQPQVVREVRSPDDEDDVRTIEAKANNTITLPPEIRQPILDGLTGVTTQGGGTARSVFRGFPEGFVVSGKTGTAQVLGKHDNSLFVGLGPAENPQYVVVAVLENAGFGAHAAGPLVRRVLEPIADPAQMPQVGPGGTLSAPIPEGAGPGEAQD